MSQFPTVPVPHPSNISEIADFSEIECLRRPDRNVSVADIAQILQRPGDSEGNPREFDKRAEQCAESAFEEIESRVAHCGQDDGRYPFGLNGSGTLLTYRGLSEIPSHIYLYMLLATRLNMQAERRHAGIDGTALFEELCCQVASWYFGGPGPGVKTMLFGTARIVEGLQDHENIDSTQFERAVNDLCKELKEGYRFQAVPNSRVTAKDGKLDVVVWRHFADRRSGQLIGFGQCKTGTHWKNDLTKLQPETFCRNWMLKSPAVRPTRLYFVTDRVLNDWDDHCSNGGIMFDRCRIMELIADVPQALLNRIVRWLRAAARSKGLSIQ